MAIQITAWFSDPDSADMALARLRRSGIETSEASVERSEEAAASDDIGVVINPYGTNFPGGLDESWTSLAGANMQVYGGFLWSFGDAPVDPLAMNSTQLSDTPHRGEVKLSVVVDDAYAGDAEGIIVSCHGARVGKRSK